jgi:hypothetical protein
MSEPATSAVREPIGARPEDAGELTFRTEKLGEDEHGWTARVITERTQGDAVSTAVATVRVRSISSLLRRLSADGK